MNTFGGNWRGSPLQEFIKNKENEIQELKGIQAAKGLVNEGVIYEH